MNNSAFRNVCCWRKWKGENCYPTLREKREGWGTRTLLSREIEKDRPLMELRPSFLNPRTLVRTWGPQALASWRGFCSLEDDRVGGDDSFALLHGDGLIGRDVFYGVFVAAGPVDGEPHFSGWIGLA
jgi:hypothetical protein